MGIKQYFILFFFWSILWWAAGCVKPYAPPEIVLANSLLVVDGMLEAGPGAVSTIKLSRTRRLSDTTSSSPERNASVWVESLVGDRYVLREVEAGSYSAAGLPLQATGKYRVRIETQSGDRVESDYVGFLQTPDIDSLSWEEQNGIVTIFLDTHDPQQNTRFYRWAFEETWEYQVPYEAIMSYENGVLFFRDATDLRYRCWQTENNTGILLGASASLTRDVIAKKVLIRLPAASAKLGIRYSIGVKQYGLSPEAFAYWQILQKNTEQRGSLFDAQPSQLSGNIRNVGRPGEPVIGFLSASSVKGKRLFINRADITDKYQLKTPCTVTIAPADSIIHYLQATGLKPAYSITGGGMALSRDACVDCTLQGGTNKKPSFW